ncbi:hypothetical protein Ahy_B10g102393 isoform F [Arachis hypogaea]|uniref:Uncharacterized protein n=1 Tax=Arachis hypogaea TaxID=3818 RepID=A0A444X1V9_ARAHY|nr:hypothetical protein Ahy_B10g102393 isoform F [Arachis hypogaea]
MFAVTDRGCFLELRVRRLCLLSRASVAVCLPFTLASSFSCRLCSRSSPFTFARRLLFAFTRRSPFEFAFVFVWKPRCSASNSATNPRAPPSSQTVLFCHRREFPKPATRQYTHTTPILASNSATSDFYYNKFFGFGILHFPSPPQLAPEQATGTGTVLSPSTVQRPHLYFSSSAFGPPFSFAIVILWFHRHRLAVTGAGFRFFCFPFASARAYCLWVPGKESDVKEAIWR